MIISFLLGKQIAAMLLMVFMGFLVVRCHILRPEDTRVLSAIALYVVGPCLTLDAFQVDFSPEKLHGLLLTVGAAILSFLVTIPVTTLLRRPLKLDPVEQTSALYSNGGNLIIPIVSYVFGPEWILYTSGFIAVQTALFWTHCVATIDGRKHIRIRDIFLRVNILAILLGIVVFVSGVRFPEVPRMALHAVGSTIGPICMIVTGMLIGGMDLRRLAAYKRLPLIVVMRLFLYPAIMLLVYRFSGIEQFAEHGDTILLITFLAVAAPGASTVVQMAQLYGRNGEYASLINVATTLLCVISMPVMVWCFQQL